MYLDPHHRCQIFCPNVQKHKNVDETYSKLTGKLDQKHYLLGEGKNDLQTTAGYLPREVLL